MFLPLACESDFYNRNNSKTIVEFRDSFKKYTSKNNEHPQDETVNCRDTII